MGPYESTEHASCMEAWETSDSELRAGSCWVSLLVPRDPHYLTLTWVGLLHFRSSGASGVFSFAFPAHLEFPEEQGHSKGVVGHGLSKDTGQTHHVISGLLFTSLCFSLLIFKIGELLLPTLLRLFWNKIESADTHKVLRTVLSTGCVCVCDVPTHALMYTTINHGPWASF